MTQPRPLRPYQEQGLDKLRQSLRSGNKKVVFQLATGGGKTRCAAEIIRGALAKGNKALFCVPAISLVDQTVQSFRGEGIEHIGVMQADHAETDATAPVQVASIQTLMRRRPPDFGVAIWDECHVRFEHIKKLMSESSSTWVGLSATPWAKGMAHDWDDLVVGATTADLIGQGYLSEYTAYAPTVPDLDKVRVRGGEYVEEALAQVMGDARIMSDVVTTWLEKGAGRPTLAFGVNCLHARTMCENLRGAGVAAEYVDASTDGIERAYIGRRFVEGEVAVICSVRTMTTGVDLPVSCIVDCAPTRSRILHVQKIGRGLRVNPGTEDCLILDHAGNLIRLGMPDEIHRDTLCDKEPGGRSEPREKGEAPERLPTPCGKCGTLHTASVCPSCGHERKPPKSDIEVADGELSQIGGRKPEPTMEDKQVFWSMALQLDDQRKRGGKLAKGLYKNKFDVWPRGLSNERLYPDQAFMNWEKARRIRYAKSKAKEKAKERA